MIGDQVAGPFALRFGPIPQVLPQPTRPEQDVPHRSRLPRSPASILRPCCPSSLKTSYKGPLYGEMRLNRSRGSGRVAERRQGS